MFSRIEPSKPLAATPASAENELDEPHFRKMVENAWDGFLFHDSRGILFANPGFRRIFCVPEGEALRGVHPHSFLLPEGVRPFFEACRQVESRPGPPLRLETKGVRADGAVIDLELCLSPSPGPGRPVMQSFFRDITDRKEQKESCSKPSVWPPPARSPSISRMR
ncbi:MAG: PAS domain S-box protein [Pseudomonadota bacterium]